MDILTDLPQSLPPWLRENKVNFTSIEKVPGGGNNRLYKVITPIHNYLLKVYGHDTENRLDREYPTLSALCQIGFKNVPITIAVNHQDGYALYSFLPGIRKNQKDITRNDLTKIADFAIKLQSITPSEIGVKLLDAHMACFSIQDYLNNIHLRLVEFNRLISSQPHPLIKKFDQEYHYVSFVEKKVTQLLANLSTQKITAIIAPLDRRISPVDFGIHNMLFDGEQISFLDFERSGWDDPRRMIAEFVNHDQASMISDDDKEFFLDYYQKNWGLPLTLQRDFDFIVKLFEVDWLTVISYSFRPERLAARKFAFENFNQDEYIQGQLNKMTIRVKKLQRYD